MADADERVLSIALCTTNDIMTKYKTLKRCRLPDLDLTVPVSTEVTWGRPLTQEEIDHLRAWSQADASGLIWADLG